MFTVAGLHVPLIPLSETEGNVGTEAPEQIFIEVPKLNTGVALGLTVTSNITGMAQRPAVGVNV